MKVYKIPKEDLQSYIRGGRTVEVVKLLEVQEQVKKLKEDVEQGWEVAGMLEDVGEKKVKNTIKFMIDMIDEHLVENRKSSNNICARYR